MFFTTLCLDHIAYVEEGISNANTHEDYEALIGMGDIELDNFQYFEEEPLLYDYGGEAQYDDSHLVCDQTIDETELVSNYFEEEPLIHEAQYDDLHLVCDQTIVETELVFDVREKLKAWAHALGRTLGIVTATRHSSNCFNELPHLKIRCEQGTPYRDRRNKKVTEEAQGRVVKRRKT
ncbi:hypothetical protein GIB67_022302 [Kingdonia uniflora]|uniref:Uncharacterized protein n=1 Tax=Kingdonia uniflora TaxID=39325 RepID=A0A7J7KW69_9MAGN|nr:hypothetical protein GIB67_022302 [Kingdonia uniflora]